MPKPRTGRTPQKDAKFFKRLGDTADVSQSAKHAGYGRTQLYSYRDKDPKFRDKWDKAWEMGVDAMEEEARRRGYDGVEQDVYHNGKKVGKKRVYSDNLLMFMLKGRRPDRFRDNSSLEVSTPGGGPPAFQITLVSPDKKTKEKDQ